MQRYTCYKSTSWRAERAFFGRKVADRERRSLTKDFFESLMQRARLLPFRRARTPIQCEKFISYTDLMKKIL